MRLFLLALYLGPRAFAVGPLTPPPSSMGAMALTPAGLAKVQAAGVTVALTHHQDCGAGGGCVNKTLPVGGGVQTLTRWLLAACNAAGQCGGFMVKAETTQSPFVGDQGGGACPATVTTGGNPSQGTYTSNIDGQTYTDPNSPAGSAWQITTVGFCTGFLNGSQDTVDANAAADGRVRLYKRTFTYNATTCAEISGGDFVESGMVNKPVTGRMSYVQRVRQQNTCGGKVVKEVYAEVAAPAGYVNTGAVEISTGTAGYAGYSADGRAIGNSLASPPENGMDGVSFATGAPVASAGYAVGGSPIPPPFVANRTATNAAALGYITGGLTLNENDYYWTGEGSPVGRDALLAAASTVTVNVPASVQAVSGTVTIDGVVTVQGTVNLADGTLPADPVAQVRPRLHTFASEYARVMVKHSTAPILGLASKFNGLEASLSTAALQTEFCFSLSYLGSHCLDLEGSGYLLAMEVMKFFVIGSAFVMGVMYLLS